MILQRSVFKLRRRTRGLEYAQAHRVFLRAPLHQHYEMKGWKEMSFTLVCDGEGRPRRFEYWSLPGMNVGFVRRRVGQGFEGKGELGALHPLRRLAERAYAREGWEVRLVQLRERH